MTTRLHLLPILLLAFALVCACDPLAPVITPTPQIIIVTPEDTLTPIATAHAAADDHAAALADAAGYRHADPAPLFAGWRADHPV